MAETTVMATVHGTALRLKAEGVGISEHALRSLVDGGKLPVVQVGRNRMINWNTLMRFLEGETIDTRPLPRYGPGSRGGRRR